MEIDKKHIGMRISEIRHLRGMTQKELSDKAGLSQTHISRIESGQYIPRVDIAARIAEALSCTIDVFVK